MPDRSSSKSGSSSNERFLFFSIWGLLLLGGALWFFWPKGPQISQNTPDITLGSELSNWFVHAKVTHTSSSSFQVEIQLQEKYLQDQSVDDREILLAYHFLGEQSVLGQGVIPCKVQSQGLIKLAIPNPKHIKPLSIQLSLAH